LSINITIPGDDPLLTENVGSAVSNITIINVSLRLQIAGQKATNYQIVSGWTGGPSNHIFGYKIATNSSINHSGTYNISGNILASDTTVCVSGDTIFVVNPAPQSPDYYTNQTGIITLRGVSEAFGHWQDGVIQLSPLADVFQNWQSHSSD